MKRVLKKALAFLSAVAVAASMAVSASAASAGKRIVKNGGYKQVVATESGLYFTNFSESEINSKTSDKTVLCVTPDGKKKKVKVENSAKVSNCNMVNSRSVFISTSFANTMDLHYADAKNITEEYIFANGEKLSIDSQDGIYAYTVGKCVVLSDRLSSKYSTYLQSQFVVYDENGKKVETILYSSLKNAPDYVSLSDYDSSSKTALFSKYDFDSNTTKYWLVKNNKTVKTFTSPSACDLVKDKKGSLAVQVYDYNKTTKTYYSYYSAKTGKKISKFEPITDTENKYAVEESGSKYSVKLDGKVIYSIAKKKAAGYYVYENSVAIITKSGSKYGLIMVS